MISIAVILSIIATTISVICIIFNAKYFIQMDRYLDILEERIDMLVGEGGWNAYFDAVLGEKDV